MTSNKVAAFYQFHAVPDPATLRDRLEALCASLPVWGTIIVAGEGINGTIAGADHNIDALVAALRDGSLGPAFKALDLKFSRAGAAHFDRLKIKQKPEIVTLGRPDANPLIRTGAYIAPADWNALLDDPDITLIDTRKGFEAEMGTFPGAINPGLTSFRQFPDFAAATLNPETHRKIAMFCTGGIRCEKASAHLLATGFPEVYQLQGGILRYLEDIPAAENRWRGDCFVFDLRIALGPGLAILSRPSSGLTHCK
jgi:UPF0176 protein